MMNWEDGLVSAKALVTEHASSFLGDFHVLEARLLDNLSESHLYGSDQAAHRERVKVVGAINSLLDKTGLGVNFVDLCRPADLIDYSLSALLLRNSQFRVWRRFVADSPRLVGRGDELEKLNLWLRKCISGKQPDIVLIRGEPGIGKTRLLAEFCEEVEKQGLAVCGFTGLVGGDTDLANILSFIGQLWYSPDFEEARGSVLNHISMGEKSFELLIQRLSSGRGATPFIDWDPLQSQNDFQTTWSLLGVFAQAKPIVLAVDNLHYADQQVIEFLRWANMSVSIGPILVAGSFSPEAIPTPIEHFAHVYKDSVVTLAPLERSSTMRLALSTLGEEVHLHNLCRVVADKSGGNPYFTLELMQALKERGLIHLDSNGSWQSRVTQQEIYDLLPDSLDELARYRCQELERIAPGTEMDARRAAVIGQRFWLKILYKIAPNGSARELRLGKLLGAMHDQQIISSLSSRDVLPTDKGYQFQSPIFWQALYEDSRLPVGELHEQIAELLQELYKDPETERRLFFWRAWHYEKAGKIREAIDVLETAGKEAEQGARPHQAIWFMERLLGHLRRRPGLLSKSQELDLLARAAKLHAQVGWLDKAAEYYDQALKITIKLGEHKRQIDLVVRLGWVRVKQGDFESADHELKQALTLCTRKTPPDTWSRVYRHLCALHLERLGVQSDLEASSEDIQQAFQYARKSEEYLVRCDIHEDLDRQTDRALLLNNFGRIYFYANQLDQARQTYQEALTIAEELGDQALGAYMLNNLGGLEAKLDYHSSRVDDYLRRSLQIADEEDNLFLRCKSLLILGSTLSKRQRAEAEQHLTEAYWIAHILANRYLRFDACVNLGLYYKNIGEWDKAERFILEAGQARRDNPFVERVLTQIRQARMRRA
jgi:predicted ATPase